MTRETLLALAAKVEALSGPCRETDAEIAAVLKLGQNLPDWATRWTGEWRPTIQGSVVLFHDDGKPGPHFESACFTGSLDAAMALVPTGWFGRFEPRFFIDGELVAWRAYCIRPKWDRYTPMDDWFDTVEDVAGAMPALALTAAALRARAS